MTTPFALALPAFAAKVNQQLRLLGLFVLFPMLGMANAPLTITQADAEQLHLSDGRHITLAGIVPRTRYQLPSDWLGVAVTTKCGDETDRYGLQSCWLTRQADGALLQAHLLKEAQAMIYSRKPHPQMVSLYAHEKRPPMPASQLDETAQGWSHVQGTVTDVALLKNAAYLNFGEDWKTDFTIYLPKSTLKQFAPEALEALQGQTVRVRGWLHRYYGPRITLLNPAMMETVHEPIR